METILLVLKNRIFSQCLKLFLEKEKIAVVTQADHIDAATILETVPGMVIIELLNDFDSYKSFENMVLAYPQVKFLVISNKLSNDEYLQLINSGVKGSILTTSDLSELVTAIQEIMEGKIFFPQKILQKILLSQTSLNSKKTNVLTEREIEILRLLCEGLSNEQISERIHLSYDTVKWHRSNILIKCGCKNILSLYKYAIKKELV